MIYKLLNCFISPIVLRFIRLRGIAGSVKGGRRHSPRPGGRTRWRPGRLLEERSQNTKIPTTIMGRSLRSPSVPVAAGEAVSVSSLSNIFELKNIIQAKVEFDSTVCSLHTLQTTQITILLTFFPTGYFTLYFCPDPCVAGQTFIFLVFMVSLEIWLSLRSRRQ